MRLTDHGPTYQRDLWQRRDAALRNRVLELLWALLDRGVTLRLDDQNRVVYSPPNSLTPEELAELKANSDDVKILVQLATDQQVVPKWQVQ